MTLQFRPQVDPKLKGYHRGLSGQNGNPEVIHRHAAAYSPRNAKPPQSTAEAEVVLTFACGDGQTQGGSMYGRHRGTGVE